MARACALVLLNGAQEAHGLSCACWRYAYESHDPTSGEQVLLICKLSCRYARDQRLASYDYSMVFQQQHGLDKYAHYTTFSSGTAISIEILQFRLTQYSVPRCSADWKRR